MQRDIVACNPNDFSKPQSGSPTGSQAGPLTAGKEAAECPM